jgi:hypothetical protein
VDDSNSQGPPAPVRLLSGWGQLGDRLDWIKTSLLVLPFLCLIAYLTDAPLPVPSWLLSERRYVALGRGVDPRVLLAARGQGEAFAALPDRLVALPSARAGLEALRDVLPEEATLGPVIHDLESGLGPWKRARLVLDELPLAAELAELEKAAGTAPLAIEVTAPRVEAPVQALGVHYTPLENRVAFELLLGPKAREFASVEVRGKTSLLYSSTGAALPGDLVLRLSVERGSASSIQVAFKDAAGKGPVKRLSLGSELAEKPKVLVISARKPGRSFIEALYPTHRATLSEAETLDLLSYELVVLDGLPIGSLRGRLRSGLLDLAARRTGSILFVADSPEFGKKGDNPELEELLPVTLLPRSLKDLPDLAVLILMDVSGSMFGDKLSLAKVTGLELLRNLKPSDLVGMMLFSDERRWLYGFQANATITASPVLEPLTAGGGTDLHPALVDGLTRLAAQPIKAKHVVLVTDGVTKPADFQALADRARSQGISISTMGVGADVNRPLLERLALQTGGRYYTVSSVEAIPGLLFEDRMSETRAIFEQGRIPVLAMNGERVARIGGMAQYTPTPTASVLFANEVGDPLLAGQEQGNRAVLFFGSDLYGTYTSEFFSAQTAAGVFKDRLDALFARRPAQVRVVETGRGISVLARSDNLVEPVLLLSKEGAVPLETPFRRINTEGWTAELVPPMHGLWSASILDRGGSLASFQIAVNGGLGGVRSDAAAAFAAHRERLFRPVHLPWTWLLLFFASSLGCTIMLRVKR